jgi:four helix bundle protein
MTAKSYRELVCWQLSEKLRDEVLAILARPGFRSDRRYFEDFSAAARSPAGNISEGFGRSDATFRRHLDIALGSQHETETHLDEALARRLISREEYRALRSLARRAWVATGRLFRYLGGGPRYARPRIDRRGSPARHVRPDRPA